MGRALCPKVIFLSSLLSNKKPSGYQWCDGSAEPNRRKLEDKLEENHLWIGEGSEKYHRLKTLQFTASSDKFNQFFKWSNKGGSVPHPSSPHSSPISCLPTLKPTFLHSRHGPLAIAPAIPCPVWQLLNQHLYKYWSLCFSTHLSYHIKRTSQTTCDGISATVLNLRTKQLCGVLQQLFNLNMGQKWCGRLHAWSQIPRKGKLQFSVTTDQFLWCHMSQRP